VGNEVYGSRLSRPCARLSENREHLVVGRRAGRLMPRAAELLDLGRQEHGGRASGAAGCVVWPAGSR
jgi:hypothetical protein